MKIAVFDSGIGGLSLLNEALKRFGGVEFIYFADNENAPYGTKSKDEILRLSLNSLEFLLSLGVDMAVIACNTATSAAINELRGKFDIPIVGMEPAVKLGANKAGEILVCATVATIQGSKLSSLIAKTNLQDKTRLLALSKLVPLAQKAQFNSQDISSYLQGELGKFDLDKLSTLVLGCTHFNYFKDSFRAILPPSTDIIDGINGTINEMIRKLGNSGDKGVPNSLRYFSSSKERPIKELEIYLKRLDLMRLIN